MAQLVEVPGYGQVEFPDDMSDDQIAAAIKKNTMIGKPSPETPQMTPTQAAINQVKQNGWGSGLAPLAYDLGGRVTDMTGSPAAGYVTNILTQAVPSFLSSGSFTDAPAKSLLNLPARKLMQSAVKPSVTAGDDAQRAIGTMLQEHIYPTTAGMEKASKITRGLDQQVEAAVSKSPASVSVAAIGSRLRDPYNKALKQVNPQKDLDAIRAAWDEFKTSPLVAGKTDIPVQLAHEIKKGTYQSLGGKSYGEVGSAATEAQKALARGAREEVMKAVPEIAGPMARQADLMNVRDVAGARALIEANKNPLGLAALRMDNPLSALTFMADRWAALKAFLAFQAQAAGKAQSIAPVGMTAGTVQSQPTSPLLYELGILSRPEKN
jgi:hypothetical protein